MKKHSRMLLLALGGKAVSTSGIPLALALLLPIGSSLPSKRSLVYFLRKQGIIWLERHQGSLCVGLTSLGLRKLNDEFPALLVQTGSSITWQLLLLKKAPKRDAHFRSLAVVLAKNQVMHIARGFYAYPGALPPALELHLASLYADEHLARCTVQEWTSGFDRPEIVTFYDVENLSSIYSSISSELQQLLAYKDRNKESLYRIFSTLSSILTRCEAALSSDNGLVLQFFPKTPPASHLINQLAEQLISIEQPELL